MVPGLPSGETDATPASKPNPPAVMSGPSALTSLQETLEDIRDAVVETDTYIALSKHATSARRTASSAWRLTKNVAWVVGTSALILVVPLLYEIDKELGPSFDANGQPQPPPSGSGSSAPASSDGGAGAGTGAPAAAPSS